MGAIVKPELRVDETIGDPKGAVAEEVPLEKEFGEAKELPVAKVSAIGEDAFEIELQRLEDDKLWDQSVATASGQGCISSPGGPSC